jgi:hypothetical protein
MSSTGAKGYPTHPCSMAKLPDGQSSALAGKYVQTVATASCPFLTLVSERSPSGDNVCVCTYIHTSEVSQPAFELSFRHLAMPCPAMAFLPCLTLADLCLASRCLPCHLATFLVFRFPIISLFRPHLVLSHIPQSVLLLGFSPKP